MTVDPAVEVARIVAAESAWVPRWQRLVVRAALTGPPLALLLGSLDPGGAAVLATGAALVTRAAPWWVAAGLRDRPTRGPVRSAREFLLLLTTTAGLLVLGATVVAAGSPAAVATCLCAAVALAAPHRSTLRLGTVAGLVEEAAEAVSALALLPCLALATRGWWG